MFIKLTRVKGEDEFDIYLNTYRIISFKKDPDGGSLIDIDFPDTIRTYKVKEEPDDIFAKIMSNPAIFGVDLKSPSPLTVIHC